jgi:serine/threonine protein kinase
MRDPSSSTPFIAPNPADLVPLFPGYEIEGLIATGGMGAVYAAVQKSLDRSVAIKILPPELSADAAFRAGFEAEAKAMARLNHPNLIGVYDFGEVSGMFYIIMEYVPGCSLFHSSHGTAIDPAEAVRIVSGICSGLAHAHDNGIIHRDIKPANILLDLNANPKIGDFGLARPADRKIQESEEIFGTPHYTAPEVVNSPRSVDHRADIFSLGVILHELLTGRLPAEDPRPASVICRCDHRFDAIIRRATDPIPANRYSSAHEIERELRSITTAAKPRVLKTPARGAPRRAITHQTTKKPSGNPALVFLLITAVTAGVIYFVDSAKKQPPEATTHPTKKPEESTAGNKEKPKPSPARNETVIPEPTPVEPPGSGNNQASAADPVPKEEPDVAAPKFDVPAFLERARKIMHARAAPSLASHDDSLEKNLDRFKRDAKRHIRKIKVREDRDKAEESLDDLINDCQRDQNRIPAEIYGRLANITGFEESHAEYLNEQETLDQDLERSLSQLSPTYILGITKQIERLKNENDPAAVELLKEEIGKTREDGDYFPELMLEIDSSGNSQ